MIELICCIVVVSLFLLILSVISYSYGGKLLLIEKCKDRGQEVLKLKYENHKDLIFVIGSGTVWHYFPSGERCGTFMESEIINAIKNYEFSRLKENE